MASLGGGGRGSVLGSGTRFCAVSPGFRPVLGFRIPIRGYRARFWGSESRFGVIGPGSPV